MKTVEYAHCVEIGFLVWWLACPCSWQGLRTSIISYYIDDVALASSFVDLRSTASRAPEYTTAAERPMRWFLGWSNQTTFASKSAKTARGAIGTYWYFMPVCGRDAHFSLVDITRSKWCSHEWHAKFCAFQIKPSMNCRKFVATTNT